ncbi:hypothetical protein D3C81_433110 [compost metagenome]
MSRKIEDVLQVLAGIRSGYQSDKHELLRRVRIRVVRRIAKERGVDYQTIADTYIRRLAPDIEGTFAFDQLVQDWLASGSQSLRRILEKNALGRGDRARISSFFASIY